MKNDAKMRNEAQDNFGINVRKACPACGPKCPNFELDTVSCYAESFSEGKVVIREYFCRNANICEYLWSNLAEYKDSLEGH